MTDIIEDKDKFAEELWRCLSLVVLAAGGNVTITKEMILSMSEEDTLEREDDKRTGNITFRFHRKEGIVLPMSA